MTNNPTLQEYYESHYLPEQDYKDITARIFLNMIKRLESFAGGPLRLSDLSDSLLGKYEQFQQSEGFKEDVIYNRVWHIRKLWRHARENPAVQVAHIENYTRGCYTKAKTDPPPNDDDSDLWTIFHKAFKPIYLFNKSKQTQGHYRYTLASLAEFLERRPTLDDLTDITLAGWFSWYASQTYHGELRSPFTINSRRDALLCFSRWLHRKGYIRVCPEVAALPEPEESPTAWKEVELRRLFNAATELEGNFNYRVPEMKGVRYADFWSAWLCLAWDTGERTGAMLLLRGEWFDGNRLHVPGTYKGKTVRKGRKAATYQLKPATMQRLEAAKYLDRDRVFPISYYTYEKWFRRMLKAAGLPTDSKCLNHKIRRTFATWLENAGGNATEALQHTSRSVTTESYLDPRLIEREPPNLKLFDIATDGEAVA